MAVPPLNQGVLDAGPDRIRLESGYRNGQIVDQVKHDKLAPEYVSIIDRLVESYPVIKDEFYETQKRLTLEGNIVISVGLFGHSGDEEVWENMDEGALTKTKEMLDDMHKRKIDMADEIFVINKDGYIGDSTRSEIEYAAKHNKIINYLEK